MGAARFPQAATLLITADGGGSNGSRTKLWKTALQQLADQIGLRLTVCHFPPGTSKWNKIEHRLFSFLTQNWRGKPLVTVQAIVQLIGHTRTSQVSEEELSQVVLQPHKFHGDWNYTISPHSI